MPIWRGEEATLANGIQPNLTFLSDPGVPGPIYGSESLSLTERRFWNLTDVTQADEDANSILADNANRAIQGNVVMQIIQSGCQLQN